MVTGKKPLPDKDECLERLDDLLDAVEQMRRELRAWRKAYGRRRNVERVYVTRIDC